MRQAQGQVALCLRLTQAQITVFENPVIPSPVVPASCSLKKVEFECQALRKKNSNYNLAPMLLLGFEVDDFSRLRCCLCIFFFTKLLTHTVKHYRVARETRHLNFISTRFNLMSGLLLPAQ